MTQTKYTAEEWEVYGKQSPYLIREKGEYGKWVVNDVIDEANARLISASPDLLEALKHVIAKDGNERINQVKNELFRLAPELKPMIESAINKAEGR